MPEAGAAVSVDQLRATVARCVQAEGLRPVARELELDPRAVKDFISGSQPRASTRQRMERWYVRLEANRGGPIGPETAAAAIAILLSDVPPQHRERARQAALEKIRDMYSELGLPIPGWIGAAGMMEAREMGS